jgi:hypothetical protein
VTVALLACVLASAAGAATLTWSRTVTLAPGGAVVSLSCPSPRFCAALTRHRGVGAIDAFTPQLPGRPTVAGIGNLPTDLLACANAQLCVVPISRGGQVADTLLSLDPTRPRAPRRAFAPFTTPERITALSCPTAAECVVAGASGAVTSLVAVDPLDATVVSGPATVARAGGVTGLSCPTATQCTAQLSSGAVVTFAPDGLGGAAPTPVTVGRGGQGLVCLSAGECFALTSARTEVTFDPLDPARRDVHPIPLSAHGLSCPDVRFCVATAGASVLSGNPQSTVPWISVPVAPVGAPLTSVACVTSARCFAADGNGQLTVATAIAPVAHATVGRLTASRRGTVALTVRCRGPRVSRCALGVSLQGGAGARATAVKNVDLAPGLHRIVVGLTPTAARTLRRDVRLRVTVLVRQLVKVRDVIIAGFHVTL